MRRIIQLVFVVFMTLSSLAQKATIRGVIYDNETGETLIGAMVKAIGVPGGAISDLDGAYFIELDEGTYTLAFDYIGMPVRKESVTVASGEVKVLDIRLEPEAVSAISGGTFTVTASKKQSTETALQTMQKKSVRVMDGVSAQAFKKKGDNDAGAAISRVTGISVQGGKHVFVRGLGDRYTKTILNGMIIPGLDPDRNTVQMDIFPTNVLDNIVVYKTFTPDLPGDFTGGTVDVATKSFPSKKTVSYSASFGFNPSMHFNSDYISYEGGKYDLLAYEDGSRDLPIGEGVDVTSVKLDPTANNPELTDITKSFNKTLAPTKQMNGPNMRFGYSIGNQFNKANNRSFGYNFALNYSKQTEFYEDAYYATYIKPQESSSNELLIDRDATGPRSSRTAQWSALAGGAFKAGTNKYSISFFRTQNGESRSAQLWQEDYRENPYVMLRNNLEYTQRSVTNILLAGKHSMDSAKWKLEWKLSPTFSKIDEPDIRLTAFELTDDINPVYIISPSTGAVASRTYRYLLEQNYNAKIDLERKFKAKDGKDITKLSFGALETFKNRDYSIEDYRFNVQQANTEITFNGDANTFLDDENIWIPAGGGIQDSGVYVQGQKQPSNTYNAIQNIASAYIMHEYSFTKRLKTIYGVRYE
ncbi:MAG: TonB-dependent receptor plug domain-containing protein, partial [Bacteroidia bacterium]|nr:TonB-dependent receptor plug domain-containing protein [Bacteroidia bacterium]